MKKVLKALGGVILWFLLFAVIGGILEIFLNQDLAYTIALVLAIPLTVFLMKKWSKFRAVKPEEFKFRERNFYYRSLNNEYNESEFKEVEIIPLNKKYESVLDGKNSEQCTLFFEGCNSDEKLDIKTDLELAKGLNVAPMVKAICGNYIYILKRKEHKGLLSEFIEIYEKSLALELIKTFGAFQTIHYLKVFGENEFLAFSASKNELSDPVVYLYKFDRLSKSFRLVKKFFSLPLWEVEGLYKVENGVYPVIKQFNFPMGKNIYLVVKGEKRTTDEFGERTYEMVYEFLNPYKGVSKRLVQIFIDSLLEIGCSDLKSLNSDYELSKRLGDYLENADDLTLKELEFVYTAIKSIPHAFYTKYFVLSKLYKRLLSLKSPYGLLEEIENDIYSLPEIHENKKVKVWKSYALREVGECILEACGNKEKALRFLEKALELNNKVGVKRLVKNLRKEIGLTTVD